MIRWATFEGFTGCLASARHAAAVLGGEVSPLGPEVAAPGEGLVVLSSWHPSYEALLESGATVVPRWHSPVLQTELSDEGWKLARQLELLDAGRVAAIAVNDPALAAVLGRDRVVALPDVLDPNVESAVGPGTQEGVAVSLFGEPRGRKNLMAQAAGFALAARERGGAWRLHLSGQTGRRQGYARWFDLLGIDWSDHGFLPRERLLGLVASMDAGLVATLSESYGYMAAEHVLLGVPAVTAPGVACLPPDDLRAGDPGDPRQVATALLAAVDGGEDVAKEQRRALIARAGRNEAAARAGLARIIDLAGG